MIPLTAERLANLLGGDLHGIPISLVTGWALDHRQVKPGDAFLAIKGSKFDGHDVVPLALASGAVVAVTERPTPGTHIQVVNLVAALARMASAYRSTFHGPVIGITGSSGKTTTKEFIAAALGTKGLVLKTTGNRNTEYTAPLLWPDLGPEHRFIVVEMAMRGPGQIEHLARFSKPTIGLITNIGHSHLELLGTREAIARAKAELLAALEPSDHAVVWDQDVYRQLLEEMSPAPVFHFGFGDESACRITSYKPLGLEGSEMRGECLGEPWQATLPWPGKHFALNAAAAILVARLGGVSTSEAAEALKSAELPPMRMEVLEREGVTILLDAYNASPSSMEAAIETLSLADVKGKKIAIIGDMRELGTYAESAHRAIAVLLADADFSGVIAVGEWSTTIAEELNRARYRGKVSAVQNAGEAKLVFSEWARPGDTVLVKGSRSLALEQVVAP